MPIDPMDTTPSSAGGSRLDRLVLVWRAKALLFLGMRGAAKAVFLQLLKRWPDDVLALNSLAYDAIQSRHPAIALGYYARALKLQPEVSNAHFNHAFVAEELGFARRCASRKRWTAHGTAWGLYWCARGVWMKPWSLSNAIPVCSP